ncbi:MAG: SpoIIE family protein phosphatase [Nocardioidaceae bacterium]
MTLGTTAMTDAGEVRRHEALASLAILDTPREERFERLVRLTQKMFDVPMAMVSLIDDDRQWNKAVVGLGDDVEFPRSESMCAHVAQDDAVMVVTDPENDARFRDFASVKGELGVRFYAGQPLHAPGGVAVGSLCIVDTEHRMISERQLDVLRELADFVETELARGDELDRAGELQRNLLPRTVPHLPGYDVAGICLPASAVGGDFFDWHSVGDDFQVVLADVMGKGVPAALIGAGVRSLMRGASRFNDLETAVNRAAYAIESDLTETSTFVTLFAARLDPVTHVMTYVDAGHGIAGIVTASGEARQFESDGLPLGAPAWEPWRADHVVLEPGDTFIALSDGMLDLFDTIEEAREAARATVAACSTVQEIVDIVAEYSRIHHATDDVTCVVIRRDQA